MEVYSIIEGTGNFHHSLELRVHIAPVYMSVDGGGLVGKDSMGKRARNHLGGTGT